MLVFQNLGDDFGFILLQGQMKDLRKPPVPVFFQHTASFQEEKGSFDCLDSTRYMERSLSLLAHVHNGFQVGSVCCVSVFENLSKQFLVVIGNAKFENEGLVFMQRSLLDVLNRVK